LLVWLANLGEYFLSILLYTFLTIKGKIFSREKTIDLIADMEDFIHQNRVYYSPVEFAMAYIGGTWKIPVILALSDGPLRYGDLKNAIPHITDKMLNTQLRDLEKKQMVTRTIYREKPPRVEYALTERGIQALPAISALAHFGDVLIAQESASIKKLKRED
jgi:DNA-binding HxlR family transcriptional regulator